MTSQSHNKTRKPDNKQCAFSECIQLYCDSSTHPMADMLEHIERMVYMRSLMTSTTALVLDTQILAVLSSLPPIPIFLQMHWANPSLHCVCILSSRASCIQLSLLRGSKGYTPHVRRLLSSCHIPIFRSHTLVPIAPPQTVRLHTSRRLSCSIRHLCTRILVS